MTSNKKILGFKGLEVYQKSFNLAMDIFLISRDFPSEEKYSLTDQIRRSSRSVCTNIGEAYRKRNYPKYFLNKISDCDAENTETQIWLDFAMECNYLDKNSYEELFSKSNEIGKILYYMINNPTKFCTNKYNE